MLLYALSVQTLIGLSLQVLLLLNWSDYLEINYLLTNYDRAILIGLQLRFLVNCIAKLANYVRTSSLRLCLRSLLQLVLWVSLRKLHFQDSVVDGLYNVEIISHSCHLSLVAPWRSSSVLVTFVRRGAIRSEFRFISIHDTLTAIGQFRGLRHFLIKTLLASWVIVSDALVPPRVQLL